MLGKLIKHEFRAVNRLLIPIHLILIAVTILGRFYVQFVLNQPRYFHASSPVEIWNVLLNSLLVIAYIVALVAIYLITHLYLRILRFRKNLFTDEGYLMHTLPASPTAHILSKAIVTFLWCLVDGLLLTLSIFVMVANREIQQSMAGLWHEMLNSFPQVFGVSAGLGIPLFILASVISSICTIFVVYACITIGHSFNSHKILASVGIYIGYLTVTNLLSSLFSALSGLISGMPGNSFALTFNAIAIGNRNMANPGAYFWSTLCFSTVLTLVTGVASFLLTQYFMGKRLNLE